MGEVWLAAHETLGSAVAVKFLRPKAMQDPWIIERFFDEARILATLETRHAVKVLDFGTTESGLPFVVMEYLDGETLAARLARCGALSPASALRILSDAARGLNRAHSAGIVHRDFKPANLFLVVDEDGTTAAKLIDFGVAKRNGALDDSAAREEPASRSSIAIRASCPWPRDREETDDRMPGTLVYMAPEQFGVARTATAESDQWAFAVVAYECLTGVLPFARCPLDEFAVTIKRGELVPATKRKPSLPHAIDAWMSTALSPNPARRFPNMLVCVEALREALTKREIVVPASHASKGAWRAHMRAALGMKMVAGAAACAAITLAGVPSAWLVRVQNAATARVASASGPSAGDTSANVAIDRAASESSSAASSGMVHAHEANEALHAMLGGTIAAASQAPAIRNDRANEPIARGRTERKARRGSTAYRNDPY